MTWLDRSQSAKYLPDTLGWVWAAQRHHAIWSGDVDWCRPHLNVCSVVIEKPRPDRYDVNVPLWWQFVVKLDHARKYRSTVRDRKKGRHESRTFNTSPLIRACLASH
jgi:hypothetical protein